MERNKAFINKILFFSASILLIIAIYICIVRGQIRNIFDEMYYAGLPTAHNIATEARFWHTGSYIPLEDEVAFDYENGKLISMSQFYDPNLVKQGESININANYLEHRLSISLSIRCGHSEENRTYDYLIIICRYDTQSKKLQFVNAVHWHRDQGTVWTEDPMIVSEFMYQYKITEDDIESYRNYLLYEKVLSDWIDGNNGDTLFSIDNLGDFEVVN